MSTTLTIVLPTYNPRMDYLGRVLDSLRAQTVSADRWELLVVDNNSKPPLEGRIDLSWHPRARVLVEPTQGKMHAQIAAFRNTESDVLLIMDDDTVAAPDLIEKAIQIADGFPMLGTWSTRVELEFEDSHLVAPARLRHLLAERLIDRPSWSNDPDHAPSTPWGCAMSVRRAVAEAYIEQTAANPRRLQLDPVGDQPGYGGDTDLCYTGCSIGLGMGVFPSLQITHLIPKRRSTLEYLIRNLEAHEFSHQLQYYARTGHVLPAPTLRQRVSRLLAWWSADTLGRQILAAEDRSRAAARQTIATGIDSRPTTHR
jgi:glycosyltransferase involved in cell wall biosynthesis